MDGWRQETYNLSIQADLLRHLRHTVIRQGSLHSLQGPDIHSLHSGAPSHCTDMRKVTSWPVCPVPASHWVPSLFPAVHIDTGKLLWASPCLCDATLSSTPKMLPHFKNFPTPVPPLRRLNFPSLLWHRSLVACPPCLSKLPVFKPNFSFTAILTPCLWLGCTPSLSLLL